MRLLEKFSTKQTEVEVMKEAVDLVYKSSDASELFVNARKLGKEVKFMIEGSVG